jgi:hypothetical protein
MEWSATGSSLNGDNSACWRQYTLRVVGNSQTDEDRPLSYPWGNPSHGTASGGGQRQPVHIELTGSRSGSMVVRDIKLKRLDSRNGKNADRKK